MKTIKELKAELEKYPDNAICYAYEGEFTGIVIVDRDGMSSLGLIECSFQAPKEKALQIAPERFLLAKGF